MASRLLRSSPALWRVYQAGVARGYAAEFQKPRPIGTERERHWQRLEQAARRLVATSAEPMTLREAVLELLKTPEGRRLYQPVRQQPGTPLRPLDLSPGGRPSSCRRSAGIRACRREVRPFVRNGAPFGLLEHLAHPCYLAVTAATPSYRDRPSTCLAARRRTRRCQGPGTTNSSTVHTARETEAERSADPALHVVELASSSSLGHSSDVHSAGATADEDKGHPVQAAVVAASTSTPGLGCGVRSVKATADESAAHCAPLVGVLVESSAVRLSPDSQCCQSPA